jgi:hypothetical protein
MGDNYERGVGDEYELDMGDNYLAEALSLVTDVQLSFGGAAQCDALFAALLADDDGTQTQARGRADRDVDIRIGWVSILSSSASVCHDSCSACHVG